MFTLPALLDAVGAPYSTVGPLREAFDDIRPIDDASERSLVFLSKLNERALGRLQATRARMVLVEREWGTAHEAEIAACGICAYLVEKPRLVVGRIMRAMEPEVARGLIHPTAMVHPQASIHPSASIGAFCTIGRASIGEDCQIMPYTMIHDGAVLGKRVVIHEHCSIGGAGFGFERNDEGAWERLPHVGGVVLGDDVEMFPYANVDRGTFSNTLIGRGTKIDHYAHIGHNTTVGEDCVITAGVVTCGSTRVGDGVWMGVGAIVHQGVQVGSRSTVGLGAVLLKNVAEGDVVAGVPAKSLRSKPDGK